MHPRSQPALVALSLSLGFAVPAIASADRAPNPKPLEEKRIEEVKPPPSPDAPAKADTPPANPMDPLADKPEAKTETKIETKTAAPAADAKKTESGGMCRAGAPSGGWELLVLAALGLRARRRR